MLTTLSNRFINTYILKKFNISRFITCTETLTRRATINSGFQCKRLYQRSALFSPQQNYCIVQEQKNSSDMLEIVQNDIMDRNNELQFILKQRNRLIGVAIIIAILLSIFLSTINEANANDVQHNIITTNDIEVICQCLKQYDHKAIVFLDIDDTIITPKSNIFRATSPYRHLIDEIKINRDNIPNFDEIISSWRLSREVILVSEQWPNLIEETKKMGICVYALTQKDSGRSGFMESIEEWGYQELKSLGIELTSKFNEQETIVLLVGGPTTPATFHKGIFTTGGFGKDVVVKKILEVVNPNIVIVIDDRSDHVQKVGKICEDNNVSYLGIIFRGVDLFEGIPNPEVAEYQKRHLIENGEWLEDDAANQCCLPIQFGFIDIARRI